MPDAPPTDGRLKTLSRLGNTVGLLDLTGVGMAAAATGNPNLAALAVLVCPFAYPLGAAAAERDQATTPCENAAEPSAGPSLEPAPPVGVIPDLPGNHRSPVPCRYRATGTPPAGTRPATPVALEDLVSDTAPCTVPLPAAVADLLARIAARLEPEPGTGLVLIAVNTRQQVVTALRPDPADLAVPGALAPAVAVLAAADIAGVIVAGFGPADPVEAAVAMASDELSAGTVAVTHRGRVADGRWWPSAPTATPAADIGTPLDPADAVTDGEPGAAALAALLTPVAEPIRDHMDLAALVAILGIKRILRADRGVPVSMLDELKLPANTDHVLSVLDSWSPDDLIAGAPAWISDIEDEYRAGSVTDDETVALLSAMLMLPEILGIAVARTRGASWQLRMWSDVARRTAPQLAGRPAVVLALCAKQAGLGTLARTAADQSITADPNDQPALPD